jgi:hypothetical protein
MAKKFYKVRVANPSRPGPPRLIAIPDRSENPSVGGRKVVADSMNRYHASPQEKRRYGGSTVTVFSVRFDGDYSSAQRITGYGKTPGERKTDAMNKFIAMHTSQQPLAGVRNPPRMPRVGAKKKTGSYTVRYVDDAQGDAFVITHLDHGGTTRIDYDLDEREVMKDSWHDLTGDHAVEQLMAERGYDSYGNRTRPDHGRRNPDLRDDVPDDVFAEHPWADPEKVGEAGGWIDARLTSDAAGLAAVERAGKSKNKGTRRAVWEALIDFYGEDEVREQIEREQVPRNPKRNGAPSGSITIEEQSVLEDLAREARESEDDWGIQQGVREYLDEAYRNKAHDTPRDFLDGLYDAVMWHYGHVGDDNDPGMDKASAKRAQALISQAKKRLPKLKSRPVPPPPPRRKIHEVEMRIYGESEFQGTLEEFLRLYGHQRMLGDWDDDSIRDHLEKGGCVVFDDGEVLCATKWSTAAAKNPAFRYAAVPVDDDGRETAYVVRGKRRADMVRDVARNVPGDAVVDLQRTRTFATKHEAQAYASRTSPRTASLARRVSRGGS